MSSAYATGAGSTKKGIAESALTLDDLRVEPVPPQGPDVFVQDADAAARPREIVTNVEDPHQCRSPEIRLTVGNADNMSQPLATLTGCVGPRR
jgi:hypothetical protein